MEQKLENIEAPFTLEDIEDVRIIIKAKGKHYAIIANKDKTTEEDARYYRVALAQALIGMQEHIVVTPSLEEIKK
jgi:hypothetical protein